MLGKAFASAAVLSLLAVACTEADDAPAIESDVSDGQDADDQDSDGQGAEEQATESHQSDEQDGGADALEQRVDASDIDQRACPPDGPTVIYDPPPEEQPTPDPVLTTPEFLDDLDIDAGAAGDGMGAFHAAVDWAQENAAEHFAGAWFEPKHNDAAVIAFTDNVEQYAEEVREQFGESWWVVNADYTTAELDTLADEVDDVRNAMEDRVGRGAPGSIVMWGPNDTFGRVSVTVVGGDDEVLAQVAGELAEPAYCFEVTDPPPEVDPDGPGTTLATVPEWRDGMGTSTYAYLEVAYDEDTAARLVDENIPDDLDAGPEGDWWEDGRHADFGEAGLDTHVVAVWSSGRSEGCPEWVDDVTTSDEGVHVSAVAPVIGCTMDYNPYRSVIAVERDRLPEMDELPVDLDLDMNEPGAVVVPYGEVD